MAEIPHTIVKGHQQNSLLLWAPEEKHLFVKKGTPNRKGDLDWICYQTILCEKDTNETKCTSRIKRKTNGKSFRKSLPHTQHKNHDLIYKDLQSRNGIIDDCIAFSELCDNLALKVPVNDFFTRALSK